MSFTPSNLSFFILPVLCGSSIKPDSSFLLTNRYIAYDARKVGFYFSILCFFLWTPYRSCGGDSIFRPHWRGAHERGLLQPCAPQGLGLVLLFCWRLLVCSKCLVFRALIFYLNKLTREVCRFSLCRHV